VALELWMQDLLKGTTGSAGTSFLLNPGVPGTELGNSGDSCLDTTTNILYQKTGSSWGISGSLTPAVDPLAMQPRSAGSITLPSSGFILYDDASVGRLSMLVPSGATHGFAFVDEIDPLVMGFIHGPATPSDGFGAVFLESDEGDNELGISWKDSTGDKHLTASVEYVSSYYLPLAGGTLGGSLNMSGARIIGLPAPSSSGEPARYDELSTKLATAGGTMAGAINMGGQRLYDFWNQLSAVTAASTVMATVLGHSVTGLIANHRQLYRIGFQLFMWETSSTCGVAEGMASIYATTSTAGTTTLLVCGTTTLNKDGYPSAWDCNLTTTDGTAPMFNIQAQCGSNSASACAIMWYHSPRDLGELT
jgi:hypothetical protein